MRVDRQAWREGLQQPKSVAEMLPCVADFKDYCKIEQEPGGWVPAEKAGGKPKARSRHRG